MLFFTSEQTLFPWSASCECEDVCDSMVDKTKSDANVAEQLIAQ